MGSLALVEVGSLDSTETLILQDTLPDSSYVPLAYHMHWSVRDSGGAPLPGAVVTFTVADGGVSLADPNCGTFTDSIQLTSDSAGEIWNCWDLANTIGTKTLTVSATGFVPFVLEIRAVPGPLDSIVGLTTGNQYGTVNEEVAILPRFRALDRSGRPIPHARIGVTLYGSGGTFAPDTVTTDDLGEGGLTSWVLGPNSDERYQIRLPTGSNESDGWFTAWTVAPPGPLRIRMAGPSVGENVRTASADYKDSIRVLMVIEDSVVQIDTATATIEGTTRKLTGPESAREVKLPLAGISEGPHVVSARFVDIAHNVATASRSIFVNRPPVTTFSLPAAGSTVAPVTSISATCTDHYPAGCSNISLYAKDSTDLSIGMGTKVATGVDSLSGTIDLTAWTGKTVKLQLLGTDTNFFRDGSNNQSGSLRYVHVVAPGPTH